MQTLWNHLVTENPMSLEGLRAGRRFLRTGGVTGRAVNYTVFAIIGFIYLWLLLAILRFREDCTCELAFVEMGLLTLLIPATLYGAVSSEREKLTWDSLIMTRLTAGQIIAGKLLWRFLIALTVMGLFLAPILLCHFASGKLCSGAACLPGAPDHMYSLGTIIRTQVLILTWSAALGALSLFASVKSRRPVTTLAIVTVGLLSALALVPILVMMFNGSPYWKPFDASPLAIIGSFLIQINPYYALADLSPAVSGYDSRVTDMWAILGMRDALPVLYVAVAALAIRSSRIALQRMEAPRRTLG